MGFIMISVFAISSPAGADLTTEEGIKAAMPMLEAKHFVFPFLAHALGTFVGAYIAGKIAANHKMKFALAIGCIFLLGGIINVFRIPAPTWVAVVDVVFCYIPMAYFGGKLAIGKEIV